MLNYEKAQRLMDIMFEEDEEREKNNQPLIYHTKEELKKEKEEREEREERR